jgi:hypothetical protein
MTGGGFADGPVAAGATNLAAARDAAVAFVEAFGDGFSVWRARTLAAARPVQSCPLPDDVVQRPDGSLVASDAPAAPPELAALLRVLGALDDVRALHLPIVEWASAHLAETQSDDGSWGPPAAGEDERIFTTGMLGGHLGKTRFARSRTLDAAGDYVAERFTPERVQNFAWPALAAYTHYFANVPHEAGDAVLQWTGRELDRGFRARRFDAVQTARVLLHADAPALPGGRVDAAAVLPRVLSEQAADGGWLPPADPAPEARVAHTLDALAALVRFAGTAAKR